MKRPKVIISKVQYMALGDSYTIGEGIVWKYNYPSLLLKDLRDRHIDISLVSNPSVTGYTTQDLIDHELPVFDSLKPNFITILIGANDQFQGIDKKIFHKNFVFILNHIQKQIANKKNIIIITIPDYTKSPFGIYYGNGEKISKEIQEFNNVLKQESIKRGLKVVDIFDLSQRIASEDAMFVSDGLHPSSKQYELWEKEIFPVAFNSLQH